jgi:hypothetical protein
MTRSLLAAGALLIVLGVVLLASMLSRPRQDEVAPLIGEEQAQLFTPPSRVLTMLGGLSLAAGLGCVGLGMNRWRQTSRRAVR